MSTSVLTWEAISPAPVTKGALIQPEATDRFAPRPWLHWPPGAALMLAACVAMLSLATFHSSVNVVRRDGLSGGIAGIEDAVPLPAFVHLEARPLASHHRAHHHRPAQLRLLLEQSPPTSQWSHDGDAAVAN